jgi:hypothetical protein
LIQQQAHELAQQKRQLELLEYEIAVGCNVEEKTPAKPVHMNADDYTEHTALKRRLDFPEDEPEDEQSYSLKEFVRVEQAVEEARITLDLEASINTQLTEIVDAPLGETFGLE